MHFPILLLFTASQALPVGSDGARVEHQVVIGDDAYLSFVDQILDQWSCILSSGKAERCVANRLSIARERSKNETCCARTGGAVGSHVDADHEMMIRLGMQCDCRTWTIMTVFPSQKVTAYICRMHTSSLLKTHPETSMR